MRLWRRSHVNCRGQTGIKYTLTLKPLNFSCSHQDSENEEADMTPVKENYVDWSTGKPEIKESKSLIPATSVKGAISHRIRPTTGNPPYKALCGQRRGYRNATETRHAWISSGMTLDEGDYQTIPRRGDLLRYSSLRARHSKVLPHIRVDKFTRGVMDRACSRKGKHGGKSGNP